MLRPLRLVQGGYGYDEAAVGALLQVKANHAFAAPLRGSVQVKGRNARDPETPADDAEGPSSEDYD